tara:strand:+ start:972 stop:1373 length:402 start_codon:yes stop_codon:yes gene_type:complete
MAMPMKLGQVRLPGTEITIYQPPPGKAAVITTIFVMNSNSSDARFTLWDLPNGEAAANQYALYSAQAVTGRSTTLIRPNIVVTNASTLTGMAGTVDSITVTAYGLEYTAVSPTQSLLNDAVVNNQGNRFYGMA